MSATAMTPLTLLERGKKGRGMRKEVVWSIVIVIPISIGIFIEHTKAYPAIRRKKGSDLVGRYVRKKNVRWEIRGKPINQLQIHRAQLLVCRSCLLLQKASSLCEDRKKEKKTK